MVGSPSVPEFWPGTKKARNLGGRGPRGSEHAVQSGQGPPGERAAAVAGRPVARDPSRLLSVARLSRSGMWSSLYVASAASVKPSGITRPCTPSPALASRGDAPVLELGG